MNSIFTLYISLCCVDNIYQGVWRNLNPFFISTVHVPVCVPYVPNWPTAWNNAPFPGLCHLYVDLIFKLIVRKRKQMLYAGEKIFKSYKGINVAEHGILQQF